MSTRNTKDKTKARQNEKIPEQTNTKQNKTKKGK